MANKRPPSPRPRVSSFLDYHHRVILHYLGTRGSSTTNKISVDLKKAWKTIDDKMKDLEAWGYVISEETEDSTAWKLARPPRITQK